MHSQFTDFAKCNLKSIALLQACVIHLIWAADIDVLQVGKQDSPFGIGRTVCKEI